MKLSIIVPVYNTEKYVINCLESINKQSYDNYEVIIVNDGSPDNSEFLIKNYIKDKPKFKYYKKNNGGLSDARNYALKRISGDLIAFVDSDDYILPNMYSEMIKKIKKDKTDMAICDFYIEKNNKRKTFKCTNFTDIYDCPVSACNKVYKKELVQNRKFLKNFWYEDYNFFIKLCKENPSYSLCKKPFYVYVMQDDSIMHNDNAEKNLDLIKVTNDIIKNGIDNNKKQTIIVNHILIDGINRVNKQKNKQKKKVIKELSKYAHNHIENIFKTEVYKNSSFNRKLIMVLNYYHLYSISKIILNIKEVLRNGFSNSTCI